MKVAAYYFPNFHRDFRNEQEHGKGWTEWELVKTARPRFPGQYQPRVPLWGYEDEASPAVMGRKIDAASAHGVNVFLFDWYYYEGKPFLERALTEGFQQAPNCNKMEYALMWANHDWMDIHPINVEMKPRLIYPGALSDATFDAMCDYIIEHHFRHPSYWKLDGKPYFSMYEITNFAASCGGYAAARKRLERFRQKTIAAGFPGLHLNGILFDLRILPGEQAIQDPQQIIAAVGFDSMTSYVWVHHAELADFPLSSYRKAFEFNVEYWRKTQEKFPNLLYFPNVTVGWDSSPRTLQDQPFENRGYPMGPVLDSTPEVFGEGMRAAIDFVSKRRTEEQVITLNAWNEWTEGSYLEPDERYQYAYLNEIQAALQASLHRN